MVRVITVLVPLETNLVTGSVELGSVKVVYTGMVIVGSRVPMVEADISSSEQNARPSSEGAAVMAFTTLSVLHLEVGVGLAIVRRGRSERAETKEK